MDTHKLARAALVVAACCISAPLAAQVNKYPDAGRWIKATEPQLDFDCPMVLDHSQRLQCASQLLSVSRVAGEFSLASTATLSCATAQCFLTFPVGSSATAYADWIMPSEPVTVTGILLSWHSAATTGISKWYLDWCAYAKGEAPCAPSGANEQEFPSPLVAAGVRHDLRMTTWPWVNSWGTDAHVVWEIRRDGYSPASGDTVNGDVLLESMRIEMVRD